MFIETKWGGFETLAESSGLFNAKRLYIYPGSCMSNQRHTGRAEHWNVVKGDLWINIDGQDIMVSQGDVITVDQMEWHAAYNRSGSVVEVVEVWVGDDLREDDIERKPYTGWLSNNNWNYGGENV